MAVIRNLATLPPLVPRAMTVPLAFPAVNELTGMGEGEANDASSANSVDVTEPYAVAPAAPRAVSVPPLALPTKVMLAPVKLISPPEATFDPLSKLKLPPALMVAVLLMSATAAIGNVKASTNVAAVQIWVSFMFEILLLDLHGYNSS